MHALEPLVHESIATIHRRATPPENGGRIRHKRVCEVEGTQEEIPDGDVGRAAELPDGRRVPTPTKTSNAFPCPHDT